MKKLPFNTLAKVFAFIVMVLSIAVLILVNYTFEDMLTEVWLSVCFIFTGLVAFAIIIEKDELNH